MNAKNVVKARTNNMQHGGSSNNLYDDDYDNEYDVDQGHHNRDIVHEIQEPISR